jgi:hypothetical protein
MLVKRWLEMLEAEFGPHVKAAAGRAKGLEQRPP